MSQVAVSVNGRSFTITCDDGQEARVRDLAQYVDGKIAEFVGNIGQVGEAKLLLLAALVIADELSDTNEALQRERTRPRAADAASKGGARVAQPAQAIAARLETP